MRCSQAHRQTVDVIGMRMLLGLATDHDGLVRGPRGFGLRTGGPGFQTWESFLKLRHAHQLRLRLRLLLRHSNSRRWLIR